MGKDNDAHKHSLFKQTDIGLTDPRLMRSITSRSKDGFICNDDALNNCPAEVIRRYRVTDVGGSTVKFRGYGVQGHGGNSLPGRFARACLPRDARATDANCNVFQDDCERPNVASRHRVRWSSEFSDGQESCLSAQSELGTPNDDDDDGRAGFVAGSDGVFPSASDSSLSAEERATEPSLLPLELVTRSLMLFRDRTAARNDDSPCCEAESAQSVRKTPEDVGGDFDIYNVETTLPYMNWDYLEEQLQKAIEKEETSQSQRNDREKIRQKLAMGLDDDHFTAGDQLFKKPSLQTRLHGAKNLQICFVNEASNDATESSCNVKQPERKTFKDVCHKELSSSLLFRSLSTSNSLASSRNSLQPPATTVSSTVAPSEASSTSQDGLDFFTRQARLQAEARLALAQVRPMAHMQLQLEKQIKRKSPIADIVGIPGFGDGKNGRLTRQQMRRMNLGQLQVVVNDMHTQIEAFNTELMDLLVERDDLYLAQNSMLVDIEDLTRRAQEYDMRMKSKLVESRNSC